MRWLRQAEFANRSKGEDFDLSEGRGQRRRCEHNRRWDARGEVNSLGCEVCAKSWARCVNDGNLRERNEFDSAVCVTERCDLNW